MRRLLTVFALTAGTLSSALAADYDLPILRSQPPAPVLIVGPATFTRWSGFYFGGNISLGSAISDFSRATQPLVAASLQDTAVEDQIQPSNIQLLGRRSAVAGGGGAFLGYDMPQLRPDLVLGVEATYTHTNLNMTSPSKSVGRSVPFDFNSVPVGTVTDVKLHNAIGHMDLTDFATARGRAGYVVGNLLPYGFIGFAVGRADYSVSATTDATCITVPNTSTQAECAGFPLTAGAGQSNALLFGYTVGAGLDWALTPNIFARGEFEFVQFAPISNIGVSVASGRVGAGLRF